MALRSLYPQISPYDEGMLDVGDGHAIHWELCGNPDGKPVVFLHGGPGGGIVPNQRRFFDPDVYRILLFDQRGCGRSTPHACLEANTTWDLVADIERLRDHFGIDRWQVFGGSWGSTLALAYAESHPKRVTELVLRGIFLMRRQDIDWFYRSGASHIFPERWAEFAGHIPEPERGDLIAAYYRLLDSDDEEVRLAAAKAWSLWEGATVSLEPDPAQLRQAADPSFAIALARIECHYFVNNGFMARENQLLEDIGKIAHIPTAIVHGRYDVICPAKTAWDLAQALPDAALEMVPTAGHSAFEPGIADALVRATDKFGDGRQVSP